MKTIPLNLRDTTAFLSDCHLFGNLPPAAASDLARATALREYETGEFLFLCEAPAEGFFIVRTGRVNVHRTGLDGREQVLHLLGAGDLCGEVPAFEGRTYPASAVAMGPVQAFYLASRDFLAISRRHPDILIAVLKALSGRLRFFVNLVDDLSLKEVSARLAKYLLDLRATSGMDTVTLDISKTMLASRLGTIAETLSRTLRKMQERRILRVEGARVRIVNLALLLNLAAGEKL
jgi:CRP/FNR family transcriptional regulator